MACGLASSITIINKQNEETEILLKSLSKKIDLNIYSIDQYKNTIVLNLKKDIFEKHAVDFIIEQTKRLRNYEEEGLLDELERLKNLNYNQLMTIAREQNIETFRYIEGNRFCNCISYLDKHTNNEIFCDLIYFVMDGKVIFECWYDIFDYLRNCIVESSKNPIRSATMLTIIG